MKKKLYLSIAALALILIAGGYFFIRRLGSPRDSLVDEWIKNPSAHPDWVIEAQSRCNNAVFIVPSSGFIGYLWGDTFQFWHPHQGIDIFSPSGVGQTPVYAAYSGFLSRLPDWKSSLIIRVPADPLHPARQIWTYYTHMADADGNPLIDSAFPPGSSEIEVQAGTLLGYQGNFSGTPGKPVGVHLHFSIVKDDGKGHFLNELDINNTLDPSPYLGLNLNANTQQDVAPLSCSLKG